MTDEYNEAAFDANATHAQGLVTDRRTILRGAARLACPPWPSEAA